MTPNQKGAIAETAITAHAVELGIVVLRPVVEGRRYDLAFDVGQRILRVQCKWANLRNGVVEVRGRTWRHTPRGHVTTTYTADEIAGVAAYCAALSACYYVPIELVAGRSIIHLRTTRPVNNQSHGYTGRRITRWGL
jgi:hypothetical protein